MKAFKKSTYTFHLRENNLYSFQNNTVTGFSIKLINMAIGVIREGRNSYLHEMSRFS